MYAVDAARLRTGFRIPTAAMCEGSTIIARAADKQRASQQVTDAIDALVAGLKLTPVTP